MAGAQLGCGECTDFPGSIPHCVLVLRRLHIQYVSFLFLFKVPALLVPSALIPVFRFNFASSGPSASEDACHLQYSLNSSSWLECGTVLKLGPLPSGHHVLTVRCTNGVQVSASAVWTWTVLSQSSYQLQVWWESAHDHLWQLACLDNSSSVSHGYFAAQPADRW